MTRLGGRGDTYRNIVTMYWQPNQVTMRGHEAVVAALVGDCTVVTYIVTPNYRGTGSLPVTSVSINAVAGGVPLSWVVENEPNG